jgi:hypothetical protein
MPINLINYPWEFPHKTVFPINTKHTPQKDKYICVYLVSYNWPKSSLPYETPQLQLSNIQVSSREASILFLSLPPLTHTSDTVSLTTATLPVANWRPPDVHVMQPRISMIRSQNLDSEHEASTTSKFTGLLPNLQNLSYYPFLHNLFQLYHHIS